jgi:anaerobic ribonucleoside-triphosphate reductase activating protein
MTIRLFGTVKGSITDGPGIRYTLFVQGCPHHCFGCHNPSSHSFTDGYLRDTADIFEEIKADPLLDGVTFSGGEPFMQAAELAELAGMIRTLGLPILLYSGYTFTELLDSATLRPGWKELLQQADVLIDGRFELAQRSFDLRFRGSANQCAIDLRTSLAKGSAVLYDL